MTPDSGQILAAVEISLYSYNYSNTPDQSRSIVIDIAYLSIMKSSSKMKAITRISRHEHTYWSEAIGKWFFRRGKVQMKLKKQRI